MSEWWEPVTDRVTVLTASRLNDMFTYILKHSEAHKSGGDDVITPEDIGAISSTYIDRRTRVLHIKAKDIDTVEGDQWFYPCIVGPTDLTEHSLMSYILMPRDTFTRSGFFSLIIPGDYNPAKPIMASALILGAENAPINVAIRIGIVGYDSTGPIPTTCTLTLTGGGSIGAIRATELRAIGNAPLTPGLLCRGRLEVTGNGTTYGLLGLEIRYTTKRFSEA